MPGANEQQIPALSIKDEFKSLLHTTWTRHVACQNECLPPESCSCQRKIVHVHAVEKWWKRQASESVNNTKLDRFVHSEMRIPPNRSLPYKSTRIITCVRILSLLLRQDREHLTGLFHEASMYDDNLAHNERYQNLREQLTGVVHREEVEAIIGDFHREKWEFCPLELTFDMDVNLHGTKVIPPFCSKIKLFDKGGTASVYWVAVQKDLISDSALILALRDSLYVDKKFGDCYQMVLKSYCGNKKRDFELEKEAFSGLQSNDKVPILQYLGSYTHDYGEGKGVGKTYNLLLEYGENDLYQAWADETNVPPVQAQEIHQNWNSLFDVAKAIRHVHGFEIYRDKGQPRRFRGWHADIKPDNILSVRGRLKLADFGFSSFAPVIEGHGGSEPKDVIRGFTDSYGAPEVSRMKQPDGTMSGVSQSIDAWSFGCVLSVAATWIVLGFQGIRQYERLRQLSPANNKNGHPLDRFHDGTDVLPEVGKWHDYLRGHLRSSDTTTELVLDLIETKLLRGDPQARYNMTKLCLKLRELSDWAEHKIRSLDKHSRDTDPVVMKALSDIEELAQSQKSSESKINFLQQPLLQVNPRERASMQINKEEMIRNKPLGQTTHRKQILEKKLVDCSIIKRDEEALAGGVHNGAVTHSPTDTTAPTEQDFLSRKTKRRNPQHLGPDQNPSDVLHYTPSGPDHHISFVAPATPPPSGRQHKLPSVGIETYNDSAIPFDFGPRTPSSQEKPNLHISTTVSPSDIQLAQNIKSDGKGKSLFFPGERRTSDRRYNASPSSAYRLDEFDHTVIAPLHEPKQRILEHGTATQAYPLGHQNFGRKAGKLADTTSTGFPQEVERVHEPVIESSSLTEPAPNPGPSINVSHPQDTPNVHSRLDTPQPGIHIYEKQAVDNPFQPPLPVSALDLTYDICIRRKVLNEHVSKGIAKGIVKMKGRFGMETMAPDASLKATTFSNPRELIFVVDNGWTMFTHWPIVTFVTETLAKSAAGLDKSGFDLKFTIDGHKHDAQRLKGDPGRNKLKKALRAAWPEHRANNHATTNMAQIFEDIFLEWSRAGQPATTLLVLTDGVWSNTNPNDLNKTILKIAGKDGSHTGNRHFSIQFIRFGDGSPERDRLQWLDDSLCAGNDLRDIIDHCSWRAKVDKMLKGSIEGQTDVQDSDEEPILYDYNKLYDLFDTFNKGEEAVLSPTGTLFRSPSRASHRSSTSVSYSRDWTERR